MKKTAQSLLTAAMFAAAASAALGAMPNAGAAEAIEEQLQMQTAGLTATLYGPMTTVKTDETEVVTTPTEEPHTTVATLYGPPYIFTEDTEPMMTEPYQPLYGPPPSLFEPGDVNLDNKFDARDLSLLKQILLEGTRFWDEELDDLDYDGDLDIDDIKALRRKITGKSKEQEEQEELEKLQLIETTITTSLTTTVTTTPTIPTSTLYGPPPVAD